MGSFADLISPDLAGHSAGVAELATAAAQRCRMDPAGITTLGRAALVTTWGGSRSVRTSARSLAR